MDSTGPAQTDEEWSESAGTDRSRLGATGVFRAVDSHFHYEALDALPGHILILDARRRGYPIVFANRATLRDYGHDWSDMIGLPFSTFVDPNGH